MTQRIRAFLFLLFSAARNFFAATGLKEAIKKLPMSMSAYRFLYELLKPRGILLVHAPDYAMYVNSDDVSVNCRLLIDGIWEPHTTALFRSLVGKGMVVADVGAHTGYYTLLASRLVGEDGRVFAFEPAPDNFALLCQSIKANGFRNCLAMQKAVSDSGGMGKLALCAESAVGHTLRKTCHNARFVETQTVTLDAFFEDKGHKCDVIKVDAEGAEMAILRGMEKILDKNPDLIFFTEFLPRLIHEFGDSAKEYFERIAAYGFNIWHIDEEKRRIEALNLECLRDSLDSPRLKGYPENSVNLLCLRGEAAKRFYLLSASLPRCSAALSTSQTRLHHLQRHKGDPAQRGGFGDREQLFTTDGLRWTVQARQSKVMKFTGNGSAQ